MKRPQYRLRDFSSQEHETWRILYRRLTHCRAHQAVKEFTDGVEAIGITSDRIPLLEDVNSHLKKLTGWIGVPVAGLEDNARFFQRLERKEFPIGNFIRDAKDVNYTPAPDVFHDLYGHLPLLANGQYAEFCQEFGQRAAKFSSSATAMDLWGRLFWFGVEFPLLRTVAGLKIFGGGILSSYGESNYCLSDQPEVLPFDAMAIIDRSYKIDEFQKVIFVLESKEQLYRSLPAYEKAVALRNE